jgi:hypothetical protein
MINKITVCDLNSCPYLKVTYRKLPRYHVEIVQDRERCNFSLYYKNDRINMITVAKNWHDIFNWLVDDNTLLLLEGSAKSHNIKMSL